MPWRADPVTALIPLIALTRWKLVRTSYRAQGKEPGEVVFGNAHPLVVHTDQVIATPSRLGPAWTVLTRVDGMRFTVHVPLELVQDELREASWRMVPR